VHRLHARDVGTRKGATCRGLLTELIERCARGDEDAMGRLVDLLQPLVLAAAGHGFPHRPADEVAVEAFVRVWREASTYDRRNIGPVAWVLRQVSELAEPALPSLAGDHP
jgi:DNA-directed RNA polymerase specialized sigma24 family protein